MYLGKLPRCVTKVVPEAHLGTLVKGTLKGTLPPRSVAAQSNLSRLPGTVAKVPSSGCVHHWLLDPSDAVCRCDGDGEDPWIASAKKYLAELREEAVAGGEMASLSGELADALQRVIAIEREGPPSAPRQNGEPHCHAACRLCLATRTFPAFLETGPIAGAAAYGKRGAKAKWKGRRLA